MTQKAPGKSHREGISVKKLIAMFPTDDAAREWFEGRIWPEGPYCPHCGSFNVQHPIKHKTMTHRCRECEGKPRFSLKTGNIMEGSKLGYQTWAIAIYLVMTGLKGVSSMKLHRDLEITQKSAWHLAHRLRKAFEQGHPLFGGPVESDATFIGGKRKNMSNARRKELAGTGRGGVGKEAVVGAKDRETNTVAARHVERTTAPYIAGFVAEHTVPGAKVYTDDAAAYGPLQGPFQHEAVNHSASEYVRGDAHTNGMEAFWAAFKRGFQGTYHKMSPKHLDRYVTEFASRHNVRDADTVAQMAELASGMVGKRLRYRELIADNGLPSGARGG